MSSKHFARSTSRQSSGFTLVELLTVIGIIAILTTVGFAGTQAAFKQARKAQEVTAARNLLNAYVLAADPDSSELMAGYDRTVTSVNGPGGVPLGAPACQRYPWRLASFVGDNVVGSLFVGDVTHQVDLTDSYSISLYPTFGMNYIFVGGDKQTDGTLTYPSDCITRTAGSAPVLVFASASAAGTSQTIRGYCILTPPNLTSPMWSTAAWSANSAPGDYGNVDARFGGKAVCAFLDGSVRTQTIDELRDMTLWSRNASLAGNPNYTVTDTVVRGGRQ